MTLKTAKQQGYLGRQQSVSLLAVSPDEAGEAVSSRHCPAPEHWHPHLGQCCYLRTGPAVRKELLNMDIVDRCTFDSTKTGAEAASRICRTFVE